MDLQIFTNEEFGSVRTIYIDEKPYFMASDIAKALGYMRPNDAINNHCRATVKHSIPISGKMQEVNFIGEGDMYRLISHSKLESAIKFENWVFDEVLPQIRKTGGYIPIKQEDSDMEILARAVLIANNTLAQKEALIAQQQKTIDSQDKTLKKQKPLVEFAVQVAKTDDLIDMMSMSKLLSDNGIQMGRKTLFTWLLDNKYFFKKNGAKKGNVPYQKYITDGYFVVKESVMTLANGKTKTTLTTYVTGKGQVYLVNKIKKYFDGN